MFHVHPLLTHPWNHSIRPPLATILLSKHYLNYKKFKIDHSYFTEAIISRETKVIYNPVKLTMSIYSKIK